MHDVLATVDDEQHLLVFEERDQTGNRIVRFCRNTQNGRERAGHARAFGDGSKVNEADAVSVPPAERRRSRERHRCFPDAARTDDGDEPPFRQLIAERCDHVGAADHTRQGGR